MVKLGVYLLARLDPAFGEWPLWEWLLKLGSVTAAWAMVLALRERDLKRILAWSTVATLGTLVMLIGLRGEGATVAVGALLLAHGLYKAPLFFVAGNVDHGAGTRDHRPPRQPAARDAVHRGRGAAGRHVDGGRAAVLRLHRQGRHHRREERGRRLRLRHRAAYTFFGAVAVAVAGVAAIRVFWRHPGVSETCEAHEGGPALVIPPLVLALTGILLGLFPFYADELLSGASVAMTPGTEAVVTGLALQVGPALGSLAGDAGDRRR
jgi:multicomponent Na+:H+ antiporter subunit A